MSRSEGTRWSSSASRPACPGPGGSGRCEDLHEFPAPPRFGGVRIGLAPAGAPPDPRRASELTWTDSGRLGYTPEPRGAYQVRVVLEEMEGQRFAPPLAENFQGAVGRARGLGAAVWSGSSRSPSWSNSSSCRFWRDTGSPCAPTRTRGPRPDSDGRSVLRLHRGRHRAAEPADGDALRDVRPSPSPGTEGNEAREERRQS